MASQVLRLYIDVSSCGRVVIPVCFLPKEIEAVELMEDLDSHTVAFLACLWVLDGERFGVKTEMIELVFGNHLVTNVVCDVFPCFINLGTVSDELGHLHSWSDVVSN
jgi:hypothetical protein